VQLRSLRDAKASDSPFSAELWRLLDVHCSHKYDNATKPNRGSRQKFESIIRPMPQNAQVIFGRSETANRKLKERGLLASGWLSVDSATKTRFN
jgi:hypothetical protein